jgi:5-methylcytosine-specific restriction protein A
MPTKFKRHGTEVRRESLELRDATRWDKGFTASRRWRALRLVVLREQPLCVECLREGVTKAASEVDHIVPRHKRPDLAFVRANLQPLCPTHHGQKTRAERGGDGGS